MITTNHRSRSTRGQSRILEAVIAAAVIFLVFSGATFLIRSSDVKVLQEKADLDRLGYNVLSRLTESGTIEATLENTQNNMSIQLKTFIHRALPSATYFNLTITNCTYNTPWVQFEKPPIVVCNVDDGSLANSTELSSTPMIYTSKNGNIYYLILVLARAGAGS